MHNKGLLMKLASYILAATALFCLLTTSCGKENQPNRDAVTLQCAKPGYLHAGDTVALISPSYYSPMEEVEAAATVLRSWGLVPLIGPNVGKQSGRFAGTAEERASDVRWALRHPNVKAIICNRGGYGSKHLIDLLPLSLFSNNPKWLVGFSDITTLLGLQNRAGVMSMHATMGVFISKDGTDTNSIMMRDMLMGQIPRYEVPPHPHNITGHATGVLVGGNLCTLTPNLFTTADATLGRDIILFIEEVNESVGHIADLFNTLDKNGVLQRCKGVVLGDFTNCGNSISSESVEATLRRQIEKYNIPVLCGFPAGHGDVNLPLVMGAPVTIDVRPDGATLEFIVEGTPYTVNTANISVPKTSLEYRLMLAGKL